MFAVLCARNNTIDIGFDARLQSSAVHPFCTRTNPKPRYVSGITAKLFERNFAKDVAIAEAWVSSVIAKANVVRALLQEFLSSYKLGGNAYNH